MGPPHIVVFMTSSVLAVDMDLFQACTSSSVSLWIPDSAVPTWSPTSSCPPSSPLQCLSVFPSQPGFSRPVYTRCFPSSPPISPPTHCFLIRSSPSNGSGAGPLLTWCCFGGYYPGLSRLPVPFPVVLRFYQPPISTEEQVRPLRVFMRLAEEQRMEDPPLDAQRKDPTSPSARTSGRPTQGPEDA
ncbi:hypothetical protein LEMLEM_LOCUS4413 [Lemmus lemmus]